METKSEISSDSSQGQESDISDVSIDDILQECEDNFSELLQQILQSVEMIEMIVQKVDGSIIHIIYNEQSYTLTDLINTFNEEYTKSKDANKDTTWGSFVFDKLQQCTTVE